MTNYTKTTDFAAKDSLPSGDSGKIIRGTEFETEFDNIATAVNSKSDANNPTFTGTVTIDGLTVNGNTVLGNAATDTVTVTADIASNLIPSADDTYNLGAVGAEWNDLHVDGVAYIDTIAGFATTENITFGDNDKAVFGAGSDLQIYHDGSNSYINDDGNGDLFVRSTNGDGVYIYAGGTGSSSKRIFANSTGSVDLYYGSTARLATTSTGIDVSGTVSADGALIESVSDAQLRISDSTSANQRLDLRTNAGVSKIIAGNNGAYGDLRIQAFNGTSEINRLRIQSNGNVSLYEDTGTTAKFVWDASAEVLEVNKVTALGDQNTKLDLNIANTARIFTGGLERMRIDSSGNVGIGTSSPTQTLHLKSADPVIRLEDSSPDGVYAQIDGAGGGLILSADGGNGSASSFIGFRVDGAASGSEKMRIDSAGQVGIGTDSPQGPLQVALNSSRNLVVGFDTEGDSRLSLRSIEDTANKLRPIQLEGQEIVLGTAAFDQTVSSEAMRIDSAGNVGIGTSSPATELEVGADSPTIRLESQRDGAWTAGENLASLEFYGSDSSGVGAGVRSAIRSKVTDTFGSRTELTFSVTGVAADTEAMRIDSNQNLLVGTTTADGGYDESDGGASTIFMGASIGGAANGSAFVSRRAAPLQLNRQADDGDIAVFRKDGTSVGSVGTISSGDLYISDGRNAGIKFDGGNNQVLPATSAGAQLDNTLDLGKSDTRFKDLYLSGGVHLGGATAANKLDDYEEGTFTPTLFGATTAGTPTYTNQAGNYTKIGNTVRVQLRVSVSAISGVAGSLRIGGLPFTSQGENIGSIMLEQANWPTGTTAPAAYNSSSTNLQVFYMQDDAGWTQATLADEAQGYIITIMYRTAA